MCTILLAQVVERAGGFRRRGSRERRSRKPSAVFFWPRVRAFTQSVDIGAARASVTAVSARTVIARNRRRVSVPREVLRLLELAVVLLVQGVTFPGKRRAFPPLFVTSE
jgi:hypothetical protein